MSEPESYVNQQGLTERYGLSAGWIKALGEPDELRTNPYYRSAPPMKRWRVSRVESFLQEHAEAYHKHLERSPARSKAASAAAALRSDATVEFAATVPIRVEPLPARGQLIAECQQDRRSFLEERERDGPLVRDPTERDLVNYVRHVYSNYEELYEELYRRVGREAAYRILRDRINTLVCERIGVPASAANTVPAAELLSVQWRGSGEPPADAGIQDSP